MSSYKPIGGYFELELPEATGNFRMDGILLNTGRNCLEYILRAAGNVGTVYMPSYTCRVMFEPLERLGINYVLYAVDGNLEITNTLKLSENDFLVYTNYFGLKDEYSKSLSDQYGERLILDCSQALFFEPLAEGHTIYSPRKYVGLPDGGILYTSQKLDTKLEQDISYTRTSHLLRRIEEGAEAAYSDFKRNDESLSHQPLMEMSEMTQRLMRTINFGMVKDKRRRNFQYLKDKLQDITPEYARLEKDTVPMYLPVVLEDSSLIRSKLIEHKIFTPTYWPELLNEESDGSARILAEKTVFLPIDQRYTLEDMERIVEVVVSGS